VSVEPRLARRLTWLIPIAFLLAGRTPAVAQSIDQYVAMVDQYASGDEDGALRAIVPTSGRIPSDVTAHMRTLSDRRIRCAIMLHTELAAVFLSSARSGPASVQISNAQRLFDILGEDTRRRETARPFAIRWYAFATNLYAGQGLFVSALTLSRDGLSLFPNAPELFVARGTAFEMRATLIMSVKAPNAFGKPLSNDVRRNFETAAADYQRALTVDPAMAFAYLHRGWVHLQLGDGRARADLEAALRAARDDEVRYLAHLFLGGADEQQGDLEAARRHFGAAHRLGPFQTSAIALGRVETAMGHADLARSITAEYAQEANGVEDPWWNYQLGGFAPGAITWLRAEARRP
jgi:tetratricopeptide (TPR) repeat protein